MSKMAIFILEILNKIFPACTILNEVYINYKGKKLFFDFYIRELEVYIEVQGRQHVEFVKYFHGDREAFIAQKYRDNLKIQYIQEKGVSCLVRFYYNEEITEDLIRKKINEAIKWGFCE